MSADDRELLHRHLNGDLDAAEQADFFARLRASAELRRELAALSMDEMLVSELVLEGRTAAPRRRRTWIPASIAAAMLVGLTLLLLPGTPPPQPTKETRRVERPGVEEAVRRACAFLESRRSDLVLPMSSEKRHAPPPRRTYAELALLALHRGGTAADHPLQVELLGVVKGRSVESTYVAGLQAIALAELDPLAHHERIRYCAQLLVDSQCVNGQWDYAVKPALPGIPATGRIRRRADGPPSGDNSATSYAVLGLQACARAGVDVDPDVLERARAWWLKCQNEDGGWGYNDSGKRETSDGDRTSLTTNASYGSATAAGLASLAALRGIRPDGGGSDRAIQRGVDWLGANFAADRTPRKTAGFLTIHWLVSAGRAGQILGLERFGTHDWYAEGADFLVQAQRASGEWLTEQGDFMAHEKNDVLETCLAVLFLRRKP